MKLIGTLGDFANVPETVKKHGVMHKQNIFDGKSGQGCTNSGCQVVWVSTYRAVQPTICGHPEYSTVGTILVHRT
jgi:hypothetical protein